MKLYKTNNIFQEDFSYFEKKFKNLSKSSNTKNNFNKTVFINRHPNLLSINSYKIQDKNKNNSKNKFASLKDNLKIFPNNSIFKKHFNNFSNNLDIIKNKSSKSIYLKTFESQFRLKKFHPNKTNFDSLKTINVELFDKPIHSYNNKIKYRTFTHNFKKVKTNIKDNSYLSSFSSNKTNKDSNNSYRNKNYSYKKINTQPYVYNDKVHLKFSKNLYKYKYIKSNLYLACLKNVNNKKNIFNLSPEEYNGKNILLSPINALNYNNEINNLGKKFITNDKMCFNNFEENKFEKSLNKTEKKVEKKNKEKMPCFIEKIVSYKILNQVKFNIPSPSERAKCKKFINKLNSFIYINKL